MRHDTLPLFLNRNASRSLVVIGVDTNIGNMVNITLAQWTGTFMIRPCCNACKAEAMCLIIFDMVERNGNRFVTSRQTNGK